MSDIIAALKISKCWDTRFDLPLFPAANNPWIYGAYTMKLLEKNRASHYDMLDLRNRFKRHGHACDAGARGLFHRWPDKSGGVTSWDEIIGRASLGNADVARSILEYIQKTDGIYDNQTPTSFDENRNLYRMPWVLAFLKSRAGFRLNVVSEIALGWWIVGWKYELGSQGAFMKRWLVLDETEKWPIAGMFARHFRRKYGAHLPWAVEGELQGNPLLVDLARGITVRSQ